VLQTKTRHTHNRTKPEPHESLPQESDRRPKHNDRNYANETEWTATAAYYARYFALYALLMKIGAESEIHDCTINIAQLLANNNILQQKLVDEIEQAKQTRIDAQYYVANQTTKTQIRRNAEKARNFVL
jgi:uncharacterized protein (UPF0332 family)